RPVVMKDPTSGRVTRGKPRRRFGKAPSRKAREGAHPQLFRFMSKTNPGYTSPLKGPTRQSNIFNESEMARSSECTDWCAPKVLDTADIVRDAMFRQLRPIREPFCQMRRLN